ncbi:MAG: hypothetical protein NVS4B3_18610 [Gemmatimonadaceae bacterium]
MSVERYYEQYWSDDGFGRIRPIARALRGALEDQIQPNASDCVDIGCGDGHTIGRWLDQRAGSYIGVDISETAVEHACSLGLDARAISDASRLPFDDASFDVAVCLEVLEHLFEPHHAAAEAHRVLRPGGVYIVTVPNVAYWRWRRDLALRGAWDPFGDDESVDAPWRDPHIRFFTADVLRRMLRRAGFGTVEVFGHEGEIGVARVLASAARAHAPTQRRLQKTLERSLLRTLSLRLHAVARKV